MPQHKISPLASAGRRYSHDYSVVLPLIQHVYDASTRGPPKMIRRSFLPPPSTFGGSSHRPPPPLSSRFVLGEQIKAVKMS